MDEIVHVFVDSQAKAVVGIHSSARLERWTSISPAS